MRTELGRLRDANPVSSDNARAWLITAQAEKARHRALDGGVGTFDLKERRPPYRRWPVALAGAALVLVLALPAFVRFGDQLTPTPITTLVASTTLASSPEPEGSFYTSLVDCVGARTGENFGEVTSDGQGLVSAEGQDAIDSAAEASEDFSRCLHELRGPETAFRTETVTLSPGSVPGVSAHLDVPSDWIRTDMDLTPIVTDPTERISISTFPVEPGGERCAHVPVRALEDLTASDVLVQILERSGSATGFAPRPPTFVGRIAGIDLGDHMECISAGERSDLATLRWLDFAGPGRGFYVLVALGTNTGPEELHTVEAMLDSFDVEVEDTKSQIPAGDESEDHELESEVVVFGMHDSDH